MTDKQLIKAVIERLDSLALEYHMCRFNNQLEDRMVDGITKLLQAYFEYFEKGIDENNLLVELSYRTDSRGNVWDFEISNVMFSNGGENPIELSRERMDYIEREVNVAIDEANRDNYLIAKTDV